MIRINTTANYVVFRQGAGRHLRVHRSKIRDFVREIQQCADEATEEYFADLKSECAVYVDSVARAFGVYPRAVWDARSVRQCHLRRMAMYVIYEEVGCYQKDLADVFGLSVHYVSIGIAKAAAECTDEELRRVKHELNLYMEDKI